MSKFSLSKLFFGAALAGAAAATAYTFVKKYREIAPKALPAGDGEIEAKPEIDYNAVKQAAGETFEAVKTEAGRIAKTLGESAKAVGSVVMDNYGDDIQAAKEKAGEKFDEAKEYAGVKFREAKDLAGVKFAEAKEYAGEKFNQAKSYIQDKYEEFSKNNPKVSETIDSLKEGAERTYTTVKEKVNEFVEELKTEQPEKPCSEPEEDGCADTDPIEEALEEAEELKEEIGEKKDDFIQNL
ncbi:MAG: hypothetical protein IK088_05400 [Lachnospiraceae bacterium]|nr:hypothetical protein [Lachnospiraceae bacterium]